MSVAEMFREFLGNLAIDNVSEIGNRYEQITRCLNQKYRNSDSLTNNSLQVGSYGRRTAIRGVSDLDMIYVMPDSEWSRFKDGRQSALLQEIKQEVNKRYPNTKMRGDGQVVVVEFGNQCVELVPAFQEPDGSFTYPNTNDGGSWPKTDPRPEIEVIKTLNDAKNNNLRRLCKMVRAWKNKHGVAMGGLLIDTLAYNYLKSTDDYDSKSYGDYDKLVRDFFEFLMNLSEQSYFYAPGSNQKVYVKCKFQPKAKKAHKLCIDAINATGQKQVNKKWKAVFGRPFPDAKEKISEAALSQKTWTDTEEFIEDSFPVDIRYNLKIDCDVSQNGYRRHRLLDMLLNSIPLLAKKKLLFKIIKNDVPEPFEIYWKVLNRGEVARRKDKIRGQIVSGGTSKDEDTQFRGDHMVECYIVRNGIVVARDAIDVPIQNGD